MKLLVGEQIDAYAKQIDLAFIKAEEGKLKISVSFDLCVSQIKPTGIDVDCTIGFIADRVKDKVSSTVVENQADLPLDKVYKIKGE
jgi:hypothetical protein